MKNDETRHSIDIKVLMDLKRFLLCIQSRFPNAPPPANPLQVRRTCMSIARQTEKNPKVCRT